MSYKRVDEPEGGVDHEETDPPHTCSWSCRVFARSGGSTGTGRMDCLGEADDRRGGRNPELDDSGPAESDHHVRDRGNGPGYRDGG